MLTLQIDDREKHVIPYVETFQKDTDVQYKILRLTVGDYALTYNGHIMLIIERKTWCDLASSLRDGRKANIHKLLKTRDKTNCQVAYLIEGNPCPRPNKLYSRIPAKNLRAHLDHIAFRDGIHLLYTLDLEHTAKRLFELARNYLTIKPSMFAGLEKTGGEEHLLTAKQERQVNNQEQLLMCLPSIGSILATVLAEHGVTLLSIYENKHNAETIARYKFPSGNAIGIKKAKRIIANRQHLTKQNQTATKYQLKILTCIPLISKKTAKLILEKYTFEDLISGKILIKDLSKLSRGKSLLGKKASSNIINVLRADE